MNDREYLYRLKVERTVGQAVVFGIAALGLAYLCLTNDRALFLFCIPLTKNGATIFYGAFAALSAIISASAAVNVARRSSLRQRVVFTRAGLVVPRSKWTNEETVIPYADIDDVKRFTEPDDVLIIRQRGGEYVLELDLLPSERDAAEFVSQLNWEVQAARDAAASSPAEADPCPE